MIAALDGWAYDYMMEMLTPIMHLISKVTIPLPPFPLSLFLLFLQDTSTFLQGSYQGTPFVTMVVNVCNKVLEQEK